MVTLITNKDPIQTVQARDSRQKEDITMIEEEDLKVEEMTTKTIKDQDETKGTDMSIEEEAESSAETDPPEIEVPVAPKINIVQEIKVMRERDHLTVNTTKVSTKERNLLMNKSIYAVKRK